MWRPFLHFLWIGAALFVVDRVFFAVAAPVEPVVVGAERVAELSDRFLGRMGRMPEPGEISALVQADVDDELLYREALAQGFDRGDPVIQRRLVQNMRFAGAGDDADAGALYEQALELGMDRQDPVVRRRLVQRMRLAIEAAALDPEPAESELRAAYAEDPARYTRPARIQLYQIYFTDVAGASAAQSLLPPGGPTEELAVGDPFLHSRSQPLQSGRDLAQRFGAEFADAAFLLTPGSWSEPIPSAYGAHLLWVKEKREAEVSPLESVRDSVRHAVLATRREKALADALSALRALTPTQIASP